MSMNFHIIVIALTIIISAVLFVSGLDSITKVLIFSICMIVACRHQIAYYNKQCFGVEE
jgi:hypothetical protein